MKLIRVSKELYRDEKGNYRVSRFPWTNSKHETDSRDSRDNAKANPWCVYWTDWMSVERMKRFRTLNEARAYLNGER